MAVFFWLLQQRLVMGLFLFFWLKLFYVILMSCILKIRYGMLNVL